MRKMLVVFVALVFTLSLAAVAMADKHLAPAKPAEPMKAPAAAAPAKAAEPAKAAAKKAPKSLQLTGTVEAVDAKAGTLTVKGKKDPVKLKAGEKVSLDGIAVGDKVLVKYSGDTASSVKKVPAKKAAVKEVKKETKAAAPAAPAAPAKPAAPAAPAAPAKK